MTVELCCVRDLDVELSGNGEPKQRAVAVVAVGVRLVPNKASAR